MVRMTEAEVESYLVQQVQRLGGITAKMTVAGRRGWPDRLVVIPQAAIALVEVKRPKGGVLSPGQRALHAELLALGIRVHRIRSRLDADDLLEELQLKAMPSNLWIPDERNADERD